MPSFSPKTIDTTAYSPEFVASVALEAYANRDNEHLVAEKYGLDAKLVSGWRQHLEQSAPRLFDRQAKPTLPGGRDVAALSTDARIMAVEQLEVSIAVLEGCELRYTYANPSYRAMAPVADLVGKRMREVFPVAMTDGIEAGILNVLLTGEPWEVRNFSTSVPGLGEHVWEGRISRMPTAEDATPSVVIWIRDVTVAARTEEALRREVALMRAISENSNDVMFAKDLHGRLQFANPATLHLIGKSLDEVVGKSDLEFLDDKDAARLVMANDRRIMDAGTVEEIEESVPMPDGAARIWLSQKRAFVNDSGEVIGLLGVSRDITERKTSEDSVRVAHDTLQRVLDSITDGLALLDRDWRYTYFSETGARMLGVRTEDLIGKSFWDLFPHADNLLFGKEYRRAMETGVSTHFEEYYPEPLNMWVECHCYPSPDGLSVYFHDISGRRRAQQAADENERRINALLEATPVGLAYADAAGRILVMNGEVRRIWGNPPQADSVAEYAQWRGWWADQSDRHGQLIRAEDWPMARAVRGERVSDVIAEIEPFDAPGTRRTILLRSVPIRDDNGRLIGAVAAQTDITEQVLREKALEDAGRRKDEFLAMLAHELRNPLAPIATAAQILALGGADGQRVQTYAEIITRQLGHMTRLIDDLLDVSRVTRGLVELENKPLAIRDIINSAIEQTRPLIEARRHELTVQFDASPAVVNGDPVRMCQIFANLLNNSAKYTPQGGKISIGIAADSAEVRIAIGDNGIGIDAKLLPHVFDLFTQASRTPDRAQGGLGLGLALVDSLTRMHGGRVSAHSTGPGTGARFVVTLPVLADGACLDGSAASSAASTLHDAAHGLSIMLVDDNVDATNMLADILRLHGHTTRAEYTSTGAIAAAQKTAFDLFILDIGLPDLDGYELVRRLRSMPHLADAGFIALTGYGQAHDKVLSKAAGFDHHLVKPVDVADLHSILKGLAK